MIVLLLPPPSQPHRSIEKEESRAAPSLFLYVQLCRSSPMQTVTKNFQSGTYLLLLLYTSDLVP
jgi:hypothetical protein